ncbi:MAG: pilus assembly protein PilP [Pseudomonadota bacterium]
MKSATYTILAALLLAGCTGGTGDLERYIDQINSRAGEEIEPLPAPVDPPKLIYQAHDLRDPFTGGPLLVDEPAPEAEAEIAGAATGPRPDPNRPKEDLERFELDSLEMVGTFFIDSVLYALVEDPDGLLYRVREDNYMGRNHGRVIAVYEDSVELVELLPDGEGWQENRAEVALDEE